jgi:hypothetical protein
MWEVVYSLFMAMGLFLLSMVGLTVALAMWKKSNTICDKCKKDMNK